MLFALKLDPINLTAVTKKIILKLPGGTFDLYWFSMMSWKKFCDLIPCVSCPVDDRESFPPLLVSLTFDQQNEASVGLLCNL